MKMLKKKVGRFLGTFTNYAATASYVSQGVNQGNMAFARAIAPHAMSTSDTLTITVPVGQDPGFIPAQLSVPSVTPSTSQPQAYGAGATVTSHDSSAGITIITALGSIALGDEFLIRYIGGE